MWLFEIKDGRQSSFRHPFKTRSLAVGRDSTCDLVFGDLTFPQKGPVFTRTDDPNAPIWITYPQGVRIGDTWIKDAQVPEGVPIFIGESTIRLLKKTKSLRLPPIPHGTRAWDTCTPEGSHVLHQAHAAARSKLSVFLHGETGTGKEVLAKLIHAWSDRKNERLVAVNCGAISAQLAESELFGHVQGAFTGAQKNRIGALMHAHRGTLFLDEIGDLPLDLQVKLLRFLESGEVRPLGSETVLHSNARVITASHHRLSEMVDQKKFRKDLYYRLASFTVEIPSLQKRQDDVSFLAKRIVQDQGFQISRLALLYLESLPWPGNVRQLQHVLERACLYLKGQKSTLTRGDLDFVSEQAQREKKSNLPVMRFDEMEKQLLTKAMGVARGNRSEMARLLGVARSTIFEMLKRHQIQDPWTLAHEKL